MTGTSASVNASKPGASGLPAPKVRLWNNQNLAIQTQVVDTSPGSGALMQVLPTVLVQVVALGIPEAIMTDPVFALRLELLRYRRRTANASASTGSGFKDAAYHHPTHGPGPSGNGSHTHGGTQSLPAATLNVRLTEWPVLQHGAVIDVTDSMHSFMQMALVEYRDPAGAPLFVPAVVPCGTRRGSLARRRWPCGPNLTPGYFRFRWSITDPTDQRKQRIHGPESVTVSLTPDVHPFRDEPMIAGGNPLGLATVSVRPDYEARRTRAWIGSVSRLPR